MWQATNPEHRDFASHAGPKSESADWKTRRRSCNGACRQNRIRRTAYLVRGLIRAAASIRSSYHGGGSIRTRKPFPASQSKRPAKLAYDGLRWAARVLSAFRKHPWRFQQTFQTPLQKLKRSSQTIIGPSAE